MDLTRPVLLCSLAACVFSRERERRVLVVCAFPWGGGSRAGRCHTIEKSKEDLSFFNIFSLEASKNQRIFNGFGVWPAQAGPGFARPSRAQAGPWPGQGPWAQAGPRPGPGQAGAGPRPARGALRFVRSGSRERERRVLVVCAFPCNRKKQRKP